MSAPRPRHEAPAAAGRWRRVAAPLLLAALGLAVVPAAAPGAEPPGLTRGQRRWVESTLASMSLRQKAAQLVMVRVFGRYQSPASESYRRLLGEVRDLEVGGLVVFRSELETVPRLLNGLQRAAPVPLLVSADLERSLSFRIERGTVPLPYAMAVGAARSEEAARFTGEVTAREGRALGIHWALAPVADVNNNPANPVINIRSYGEDPELVARLSAAYIEGARAGGILTTAKHFPGHGDTGIDSHRDLPVLGVDRARLGAIELVPFRRAIAAGVDSIMLGHIAVPSIDPTGTPATLSPGLAGELLRDELGFDGLIVTDALEMAGLRPAWTGESAVEAIQAGSDVLLLPRDSRVAVQSVVRAVAEGQLTESRIDASVRRLLEIKARLGLHRKRLVDRDALLRQVARPEDVRRADELAAASITLVRNERAVLPLAAERPLRLLHLALGAAAPPSDAIQRSELAARRVPFTSRALGRELSAGTADEIVDAATRFTHVVVSSFVRGVPGADGNGGLPRAHRELLRRLVETGVPVVVVSLGSPYVLEQLPEVPGYLCAYGDAAASQRAAVAALFGEADITGRLPVSLPGGYPSGHGIQLARRPMTLAPPAAGEPALRPGGAAEIDAAVSGFVERRAFPGAALAVGYRGALAYLQPYGRLSYDPDAPPVAADTIYDLASLTKVIATTTMAMILLDEGRLDLDKPVRDFLPRFAGGAKDRVTVRHLLSHSSGVDWWAPLYRELEGKEAYLERIQAMELAYEPGAKTLYSDLGLILLGEILERVAGRPLDEFVRERVFAPLGMADTMFRPPASLAPRIAPTEDDPWRGRVLRGEVHDENAAALGGVAPHAGLFSTAADLARFAQMILNGGVFEHRRIVSRATLEEFTRPAGLVPGSSRGLGWDTKSPEGYSSAGSLLSAASFGHTGFTGTSIWIDPERRLFVILLTNRVHPTRENKQIREARPVIADAVVRALARPVGALAPEEPPPGAAVSGPARAVPAASPLPPVRVGLERLAAGEAEWLRGRRLGLVAHRASVTLDGRHAVDVLRDAGLDVARLFTPEHGLRGEAAAGEAVAGGRDPASGLPVVSLYGEHRKPAPEDLAGLDALVFDLQGAGVRFYTYVSTLLLCLEAAAEAGIDFVVLDRPNPLGGERVEGPLSAPRDAVPASFVNLAPGPLVHGLTLGEMARYANLGRERPARLKVVPMSGWQRRMSWAETGRPWVPPSPNLRTAEAALAYPGTALLEATNVSEGRGTKAPFLLLGAPWLDPGRIEVTAPGFALDRAGFTPAASPAAPRPKHLGERCQGMRVRVTDADAARPYRLGLELLAALARQPGFEWRDGGAALTRLLGTAAVGERLRRGEPVATILAADDPDHRAWREMRRPALIY